jgi:membrane-bound transcription factor site-1 protease
LDWHGDHPFTNFHDTLNTLRDAGYFVEVMHSPSACFSPDNYGAYLVMDSEEEWYT